MGRFQGFYTGAEIAEENTSSSESGLFAKRRQRSENCNVSTRQFRVWQCDFDKCSTLTDYQNYINKYDNTDNPYIEQAKTKVDDLVFANCKNAADYNDYLSSFPSGKNVLKAKDAIRRLHTNMSTTSTSRTYSASSCSSNISGEEIWNIIKKAIGVICVLLMIVDIYLMITEQLPKSVGVPLCVVVLVPLGKWAFDG